MKLVGERNLNVVEGEANLASGAAKANTFLQQRETS